MNIAIRTDASNKSGSGHFMRCLTLANALKQRGAKTFFLCRHLPEYLRDMLDRNNHEFVFLDSTRKSSATDELAHAHWLGVSQRQDAVNSIEALSGATWDWLIVDNYALDSRWESALRSHVAKIMVIDDIADRSHDCDLLLDQNFYTDMKSRYTGRTPPHCRLLLGPQFSLLRDEFKKLHAQVKPRTGSVRNLLVFFGGFDANNYTSQVIDVIDQIEHRELHVDVVIGAQHAHREEIEENCAARQFACHIQTDRIAELIWAADLAITAGGSVIWECACLGLPTLAICVADNQRRQIADAASEGLLYSLNFNNEPIPKLSRHIMLLLENDYLRQSISSKGIQSVDGRGVDRVIASLGFSRIKMRPARQEDSKDIFEWRNHPSIRETSFNPGVIEKGDHQKWFAAVQEATDKILLVGQFEGQPVGVVRFDLDGEEAEISIYLVPGGGHEGKGTEMLQSAEYWISENQPNVRIINAQVLGRNERSRRLFLGAGYQLDSEKFRKVLH